MRLVSDESWVSMTIKQEASGEPDEGKLGVAEVIRNRMAARYQSDGTAAGTVLHPFAFSGWNAHDLNRIRCALSDDADPVVVACLAAWRKAQAGSDTVKGALLYYNPAAVVEPLLWARAGDLVAIVGRHHFFKPRS